MYLLSSTGVAHGLHPGLQRVGPFHQKLISGPKQTRSVITRLLFVHTDVQGRRTSARSLAHTRARTHREARALARTHRCTHMHMRALTHRDQCIQRLFVCSQVHKTYRSSCENLRCRRSHSYSGEQSHAEPAYSSSAILVSRIWWKIPILSGLAECEGLQTFYELYKTAL